MRRKENATSFDHLQLRNKWYSFAEQHKRVEGQRPAALEEAVGLHHQEDEAAARQELKRSAHV